MGKGKGILKKPKSAATSAPAPPHQQTQTTRSDPAAPLRPPAPAPPRPLEQQIAIHQAQLLLRQRGEEGRPPVSLETFERLSQFPPTRRPSLTAARPSPDDAREFITAIEGFLPRDYQDLIEERNCLGHCGYALCPRPRRNYHGEFRVLSTGIAKTADLNMWCSDACARRALFIQVQLDNPSYVRRNGESVVKIELQQEENKQPVSGRQHGKDVAGVADESQLAKSIERLEIDERTGKVKDAAALAIERGDARRPAQQIEVTIREKSTAGPGRAPNVEVDRDAESHLILEGHKSTFGTGKDDESLSDDDDDYLPSAIRM